MTTFMPIVEAILSINLRVMVLLALVYIGLRALRTGAGEARHSAWLTALVGCLVLPLLSAVLPALSVPILPTETLSSLGEPPSLRAAAQSAGNSVMEDGGGFGGRPLSLYVLGFVYGLGVICVLGRFAIAVHRIARLERTMAPVRDPAVIALKQALCEELRIRRCVKLLQSDQIGSPFTWGVLRPRIALPAAARDWSTEQTRHVLLHELWHVRRCDWLRLCLQRVAVAVYWFNPCVWLAARQCAYEAERACDDCVLRAGGRSSDYALLLVELMASSRRAQPAGVALGDRDFAQRIRAILDSTKEARAMSEHKTRIAMLGVVLTALVLGACQVTTAQPVADEGAERIEPPRPVLQDQQRQVQEAQQPQAQPERQAQQQAEQLQRQAQQQREQLEQQAQQQQGRQVEREQRQVEQQQRQVEQQRQVRQLEQNRQVQQQRQQALVEARSVEQQARIEQLNRDLAQRDRAMAESQMLALRASLDQQRSKLAETERALAELQAQLDDLSSR